MELVSGVDRNAHDFSFAPYLIQFAARTLHPSEDGTKKLSENIDGKDSDPGLRIQTQNVMRESMAAGSSTLDTLSREVLKQLCNLVDTEVCAIDGPVGLFHWVRDMITTATTNAVYGPANPFLRKEVADGLWYGKVYSSIELIADFTCKGFRERSWPNRIGLVSQVYSSTRIPGAPSASQCFG